MGGFDYVIVGGGSAGCVLANRLSARPDCRVLLIEAGRDFPPGSEPPELLDGYSFRAAFDPAYQWPDLKVHLQPVPHNGPAAPPQRHYEQGRVIGGTSSINGQQANRGLPADYDEWASGGAPGWTWDDVLPYFRRLETDLDFSGPLHGTDGPIKISRIPRAQWPGFSNAFADALTAKGQREIADQNAAFADGWFAMAVSNDGRRRVSAAAGYLDAATRGRPNLRIAAETVLESIRFSGRRAQGVVVRHAGGTEEISAREIIVAAGALHSPAILMRAGIGPAAALQRHGVAVVADRPGVGRNLNEHPAISLSAYLRPHARLGDSPRRHIHCAWRYTSGLAGCPAGDMYMVGVSKSAWHPVGRRLGSLFTWINKPFSRGFVELASADPAAPPRVAFELLRDPRDLARLVDAVRRMADLFASAPLARATDAPFASSLTGLARAVNAVGLRNWLITLGPALLLDGPAPLRRSLIDRVLAPGAALPALLADESALEEHVRRSVAPGWHASGTCRMGAADDVDAVVDPRDGRVHGVDGLRVVDASIMPSVPRANTNIPTLMIAEKMADAIRRSDQAA